MRYFAPLLLTLAGCLPTYTMALEARESGCFSSVYVRVQDGAASVAGEPCEASEEDGVTSYVCPLASFGSVGTATIDVFPSGEDAFISWEVDGEEVCSASYRVRVLTEE